LLIFYKKKDYSINLVAYIFDILKENNYLDKKVLNAEKLILYWKNNLKNYISSNNLTFTKLTDQFKKYGSLLEEETIKEWLNQDSLVVGPREEQSFIHIAKVLDDNEILNNSHKYFESCRIIRAQWREILDFLAIVISKNLKGDFVTSNKIYKLIYEKINGFIEILKIETIKTLTKTSKYPIKKLNKPLSQI
jgi:hypothetical protein